MISNFMELSPLFCSSSKFSTEWWSNKLIEIELGYNTLFISFCRELSIQLLVHFKIEMET